MVNVEERELRRHALRFVRVTPDGAENSRVLYNQLVDYGHRITWPEFDRLVVYLERSGYITTQFLRPEIDRTRIITVTQLGIDVVEGTVRHPGVLPPTQGEI